MDLSTIPSIEDYLISPELDKFKKLMPSDLHEALNTVILAAYKLGEIHQLNTDNERLEKAVYPNATR